MKKIIILSGILLFTILPISADDIVTKDIQKLPKTAREFITKHFPDNKISYIKIDKELFSTTYDVVFINGAEIDFNGSGEWTEIDGNKQGIPIAILSPSIRNYITGEFSNIPIEKVEKESWGYIEIELVNGMDLKFNKKGELVEIDD